MRKGISIEKLGNVVSLGSVHFNFWAHEGDLGRAGMFSDHLEADIFSWRLIAILITPEHCHQPLSEGLLVSPGDVRAGITQPPPLSPTEHFIALLLQSF